MAKPSSGEWNYLWICKNCGGQKFTVISYKDKDKIICKNCKRKIYKINGEFKESDSK